MVAVTKTDIGGGLAVWERSPRYNLPPPPPPKSTVPASHTNLEDSGTFNHSEMWHGFERVYFVKYTIPLAM
jgi:hypothetical protein